MKEITLYVNVPFCNSKCHFCSYVAHIKTSDLVKQDHRYADYTEALKKQIRYFGTRLSETGYKVNAIYFGGGTPTALSTDQLIDLNETIQTHFTLSDGFQDATLETTPENVPHHDMARLRHHGFDRISMGVQSMVNERLRRIGRSHTRDQVEEAVAEVRQAGFTNVNVDLMLALPGETDDELAETLERGLALGVNHYTAYVYVPTTSTVMKQFMLAERYTVDELERKYAIAKTAMVQAGYDEYMCQYFSNDRTRCICDWVYFGLMNDWIGLGSDTNAVFQQRIWLGPSDYKKFIAAPLKAGEVFPANASDEILERHHYWALLSEGGLDYARWENTLGISLEDVLAREPRIQAWHHYLLNRGLLTETPHGLSFTDPDAKAHYVCKRIALDYNPQEEEAFFADYAAYAA